MVERDSKGKFMKGHKVPEEWMRNIKLFRKGQHPSPLTEFKKGERYNPEGEFKKGCIPWHKNKKCPQFSGENHYRWSGGNLRGRDTKAKEWAKIRKQILKRDGYHCQGCGKYFVRLEIHHIVPYRETGDDSLNNLVTLCMSCHRIEEHKYFKNKRKDEKIEVI